MLGVRCRYDGRAKARPEALALLSEYECVPFCPEQLGGLRTPRPKSHLRDGDGRQVLAGRATLVDDGGLDVTDAFLRGAEEGLRLARTYGVRQAFLKQRSPSCGYGVVKVDLEDAPGVGVAAAALEAEGIAIVPID